jgi:hypothetical protein
MVRAGMILVEVAMQVPEGTVIGAMFGTAVEAFLVRASMGLVNLTMKFPVRSVIPSMSTIVVVMGKCRCGWCRYGQYRRSNESFADAHDTSPVQAAPLVEARNGRIHRYSTVIELNRTGIRHLGFVHGSP